MNHLGNATILLLSCMALGACGGAKRAAEAPADAGAAEGGDAADAAPEADASRDAANGASNEAEDPRAAFDKAEQELGEILGSGKNGTKQPATQPGSTPMLGDDDDDGEEISQLDRANRCTTACKALASMKRSADRVCSMTGEKDGRCESLRERVERAKSLVYTSCPTCAAALP